MAYSGGGTKTSRFAVELDQASKKPGLPGWLLDKIADDKLTGGYNPARICPVHFIALSVNGTCIGCA